MITELWNGVRQRVVSRPFVALFLVYLLGIASMLRANRFYLDDLGRTLYGYADWLPSARPLTEALAWLFYCGPETMDASPLTQILAIGILALASLFLLEAVRLRPTWWALLCTVPVGLSPYGLENLSYKFDAPGMAFGLLCAVVPAYLLRRPSRRHFVYAALLLFASASFYQPALGAYLAVCGYNAVADAASRKRFGLVLRRIGRFALPFLVGVGLYVVQAPLWFIRSEYTEYVVKHASMPSPLQLPGVLLENVPIYARLMFQDWGGNSLGLLFGVLTLLFAATVLGRWLRCAFVLWQRGGGMLPKAGRLIALLFLLPCFWLTPFGIQILLESPVWTPRTLYGFGVMLALMLLRLHLFATGRWRKAALRVVQALVIWQVLVFAQIYGNLQDNQKNWEQTRITSLAPDLNAYIEKTGSCRVTFVGTQGRAPLNLRTAGRYPLLGRLATVPLTSTWRWGYETLKSFGVTLEAQILTADLAAQPRTLFVERPGYRIEHGPDGIGIVTFLPLPVARASASGAGAGKGGRP